MVNVKIRSALDEKRISRKNKKVEKARKNNGLMKIPPHHCVHCGGSYRYDGAEVSCFMCGRKADHHCDNCLFVAA